MNIRHITLAACLLLLGQAQAEPAQTLRPWTPYNDFYELQDKFTSLPAAQRERLSFRLRLVGQDAGLTPDQARLYIVRKNERIEIPIDANGIMRFPRNDQYQKENLTVYTSLAKNQRLGIKAEVVVNMPAQPSYQYGDLMKWMHQASDATRSRAGMWSLFMPKPTGLDVKLAAAAYATVQNENGQVDKFTARDDGYVFIPLDKHQESASQVVTFSSKPLEALPHYDKNMTLFGDGDR
jgi:hypothetical protein